MISSILLLFRLLTATFLRIPWNHFRSAWKWKCGTGGESKCLNPLLLRNTGMEKLWAARMPRKEPTITLQHSEKSSFPDMLRCSGLNKKLKNPPTKNPGQFVRGFCFQMNYGRRFLGLPKLYQSIFLDQYISIASTMNKPMLPINNA